MVVPPISTPKWSSFSRKTHGFVGETHHFRKPPYTPQWGNSWVLKGSNKGEAQTAPSIPKSTPFSLCYFSDPIDTMREHICEKSEDTIDCSEIGLNSMRLVGHPIIYKVLYYIPGGCLGFLNQPYHPPPFFVFCRNKLHKDEPPTAKQQAKIRDFKDKALGLTWKWGSPEICGSRFQTVNPVELLKLYTDATRMSIKPP